MARVDLRTDFPVDAPVLKSWVNQVGINDADHEARIIDTESSASGHESRIDLLEANGPSAERISFVSVSLSDADLLVPGVFTLVAPSAGYRYVFHRAELVLNASGGIYGSIDPDAFAVIRVGTHDTSTYLLNRSTGTVLTWFTFVFGTAANIRRAVFLPWGDCDPNDYGGLAGVKADIGAEENQSLNLFLSNNGAGNFTGGHSFFNSGRVHLWYSSQAVNVEAGMPMPQNVYTHRHRPVRRVPQSNGSSPLTLIP